MNTRSAEGAAFPSLDTRTLVTMLVAGAVEAIAEPARPGEVRVLILPG